MFISYLKKEIPLLPFRKSSRSKSQMFSLMPSYFLCLPIIFSLQPLYKRKTKWLLVFLLSRHSSLFCLLHLFLNFVFCFVSIQFASYFLVFVSYSLLYSLQEINIPIAILSSLTKSVSNYHGPA